MAHEHPREVIVRAIDNVSDIVEITDTQGRFEYVNRAFEVKTGWSAEEALGQTPKELIRSGVHEPAFFEEIWKTISTGESWKGRITSKAKDGTHIIQEAFISPILDAGDEITHYIAVKRDITERIQLEAQLLQADRLAAVGQLAAGVGHEINNPLAYMLANLRYLSSRLDELDDSRLAADFKELLDETAFGARQIRDIVRDLGAMARSNELNGPVDVVGAIEFALRMVDNQLSHHVEIIRDFEEVPTVWGDRSRLVQVFLNLFINGIQAIPVDQQTDGVIRATVTRDGDEVVVEVADTGCGMGREEVEHVFEPFYSTKDVGEGAGLGLSICYGIINGLGGTISVESEVGRGTVVEVRLAIRQSEQEVPSLQVASEGRFESSTPMRRVLFVDDEPRLLKLARRLFADTHEVVTCVSGDEALEHMRANIFDVVVCDLMMPELSGEDLYERSARIDASYPERFIFITGGTFTESMERFVSTVSSPCIRKPFSREELLEAIQRIGNRSRIPS